MLINDIDNLIYEISVGLISRYYAGRAQQFSRLPLSHQKEVISHTISNANNLKKSAKNITSQAITKVLGYGVDIPSAVKSAQELKNNKFDVKDLQSWKRVGKLAMNVAPSKPATTAGLAISRDVAASTGKIRRKYALPKPKD